MAEEGAPAALLEAGKNYAKIKVLGIGGAGCNALYRILMSLNGNTQSNVTYVAMNTDRQHLEYFAEEKLRGKMNGNIVELGSEGLGAGAKPQEGETIMAEAIAAKQLENVIEGNEDLIIVTAGLGGGTGTGVLGPLFAYIIEKAPKAVPVFVGTWPYTFEGDVRKTNADYGYTKLMELEPVKILTIENDALLEMAKAEYAKSPKAQAAQEAGKRKRKGIPASVAYGYSDIVLTDGISVITDLITIRTQVNLDMKDAKTVMAAGRTIRFGKVLSNESENRAMEALESMLQNPIYRNSINGGAAYLIAFYGDVETEEMNEVASEIKRLAKPGVNPIFGGIGGKDLGDKIEIAMIATGFDETVKIGVKETAESKDPYRTINTDGGDDNDDVSGVFTGFDVPGENN